TCGLRKRISPSSRSADRESRRVAAFLKAHGAPARRRAACAGMGLLRDGTFFSDPGDTRNGVGPRPVLKTGKAARMPPSCSLSGEARLKRPRHHLDAEALDDIADAHVLVVLEGHAAFLAARHFGHFVLEALQGLQRA